MAENYDHQAFGFRVVAESHHDHYGWPRHASYYAVDICCKEGNDGAEIDEDARDDLQDELGNIYPDELLEHPVVRDMIRWFNESDLAKEGRIKRGDIVHFLPAGDYRNDGRLIFDGKQLLPLYNDRADPDAGPDEYGYIPNTFLAISEFPADYWQVAIVAGSSGSIVEHNCCIYADFSKFDVQWSPTDHPVQDSRTGLYVYYGTVDCLRDEVVEHGIFYCVERPLPNGIQDVLRSLTGLKVCSYDSDCLDDGPSGIYCSLKKEANLVIRGF
jgi:hypothetical protein